MNGDHHPLKDPHLYPTAPYLLWGATLILGGSTQLVTGFVLGLAVFLTVSVVSLFMMGLRDQLPAGAQFPVAILLSTLLVTAYEILLDAYAPAIRHSLGLYLDLVALTPLIPALRVSKTTQDSQAEGPAIVDAIKFWGVITLLAAVREALGTGNLTVWPKLWAVKIPILSLAPLQIGVESAGGFFLAAALVVLFRVFTRRTPPVAWSQDPVAPKVQPRVTTAVVSPAELPPELPPETRVTDASPEPLPEVVALTEKGVAPEVVTPTETAVVPEIVMTSETVALSETVTPVREWGENLESMIDHFMSESAEKRRFLVIGCGTGELAWYIAFLALEGRKKRKVADFRVRGTDPFGPRIQSAKEGNYREHQLDFIPEELKRLYVLRGRDDERHQLRVGDEVRPFIEFDCADFHEGRIFFHKTADVIILNQSLEGLSEVKKKQVLASLNDDLTRDGALVWRSEVERSYLPETLKRTGDTVFRKI